MIAISIPRERLQVAFVALDIRRDVDNGERADDHIQLEVEDSGERANDWLDHWRAG